MATNPHPTIIMKTVGSDQMTGVEIALLGLDKLGIGVSTS